MLARLEGISAGSGVPLRSLSLINAMEAFLGAVRGRTVPAPPGACSAVGVRGRWSHDSGAIVAHNFDYVPLVQPFYVLRESRPRNGFRSLEFAVAAQAGAVDGMNEKGLCITLNYAFAVDEGQPGPLITMAIGNALATCATAAEAADRIRAQPRWGGGLLMLADASGEILSLELSNTRAAIRRPAAGEDWLVFTNVCRCAETKALQVPEAQVFSSRVPGPLRGQPVLDWHARRESRIEALVRSKGLLGGDELAAIMADHGPANAPDGTTPCVHTDYWRTTAALQWFPAQRRLRVAFSTACKAKYVEIAL
jgi:hypothetical protein